MFKTNAIDSVGNRYVDEDPARGINGTRLIADDRNIVQDELTNAIERSGQTLDPSGDFTHNDQLATAMFINAVAARTFVDNGSANTYQLTPLTGEDGLTMPGSYSQLTGATIFFKPANANTGASTVEVGQTTSALLPAKALLDLAGNPLNGGELSINSFYEIKYDPTADGGNGAWIILSEKRLPGNVYYPDYNEADQGADGNTVKTAVDALGSKAGAIILRNNSGGANTTYTWSTSGTIPPNITLIRQAGAILSDGGGDASLTINGKFVSESPLEQCFDWTGTGSIVFANGSISQAHPEWWYNGDWAAAINAALAVAYATGIPVKLQARVYDIGGTTIGLTSTDSDLRKMFPPIIGSSATGVPWALVNNGAHEFTGTIIKYSGTGEAVKFDGTATLFDSGLLKDFTIIKESDKPADGSTGLWIYGAHDYRIYNVSISGFETGFKNEYGWTSDIFGMTAVRCRYGIVLNQNSNALGLFGVQAHQNKVGIKILGGRSISINRATTEGCDVGIVIHDGGSQAPRNININTIYNERNTTADLRIGADEDGAVSATSISTVLIGNLHTTGPGPEIIGLYKADNIILDDLPTGQRDSLMVTADAQNVRVIGSPGYTHPYLSSEKAYDNSLGIIHNFNLVPNGYNLLPNLQMWNHPALTANKTNWATYFKVVDDPGGTGRSIIRVRVDDGTDGLIYLRVKLDKRFYDKRVYVSVRAKRNADLTATLRLYDETFSALSGGGNISIGTSWNTYSTYYPLPSSGESFIVAFDVSNTSGGIQFLYFENLIVTLNGMGEVQISPMDILAGLSYCVNTTEDAGGTHDGDANAAVLTDSSRNWVPDSLVGLVVNNTSDGSSGTITANTATTITAALTGGTDNDWDVGDAYTITGAVAIVDMPEYFKKAAASNYEILITSYAKDLSPFATKDDGRFAITTDAEGTVSCLVIPKMGYY